MTSLSMRERMLAGEPYYANDEELVQLREAAWKLVHTFNTSSPEEGEKRKRILRQLLGAMGKGSEIKQPFYCDYGSQISVGDGFFANYDCVILDCNKVNIGDGVLLGPKVQIYTATHPLYATSRQEGWEAAHPISIGDNVWIGGGAIINPGIRIGTGTTIGAGSVVTRDIPENVFAAGNPCRVIREL